MTQWIVARQAPLSMGICQARILESVAMQPWYELMPPGYLPNLGTELSSIMSPTQEGVFFTNTASWEAQSNYTPKEINFKK